jgi:hypothetical protein
MSINIVKQTFIQRADGTWHTLYFEQEADRSWGQYMAECAKWAEDSWNQTGDELVRLELVTEMDRDGNDRQAVYMDYRAAFDGRLRRVKAVRVVTVG